MALQAKLDKQLKGDCFMKRSKWFIRLAVLSLLIAFLPGSASLADWRKDSGGWWYSSADGSYARNEWMQDGNSWYYFGNDGYMVTGWQKISGTTYYFDQSGKMAAGWTSVGGSWYHFDGNGHADTGWLSYNGNWYYLDSSGKMETGWVQSGSSWYYMQADGSMARGWKIIDGIWYYLDSTGAMATGWRKINGAWYCFDRSGRMYSNTYIDQKYFLGENGQWDGVTIGIDIAVTDTGMDAADSDPAELSPAQDSDTVQLTFHEDGWYVARLEVELWDIKNQSYKWIYSDSRAKGQKTTLTIDTTLYEINRVGYQIWFFGWDNDYMNLPWANTDYATDFTLSGSGDYPEFTWK